MRITLRDRTGRQPDREVEGVGVQKIHRVAGNFAVGFAGNIDAGFRMVAGLEQAIRETVPPDHGLNEPGRFLHLWARRVRFVWKNRLPDNEKQGGCDLLAVIARPPVNNGLTWPTDGWIMRHPDFKPERIPRREARSIGSGEHVDEYARELEKLGGEFMQLQTFEVAAWQETGGVLFPIALVLTDLIQKHEQPGISPHLHLCSVRWGQIEIATNDRDTFSEGQPVPDLRMPTVARNPTEWQALKRDHGLADLLAIA
jgi:hypothetical protein